MAIQVLEDLKKLQKELDKLSSAVSYIDKASKIAKTSEEINGQFMEFGSDITALEKEHRTKLIKQHGDQLSKLSNSINNLLEKNKEQEKELSRLMEELEKLEKSVKEYFARIAKIDFPGRLDKIDNQISSIHIGVGNIQSSIQSFQMKMEDGLILLSEKTDKVTKGLTSVKREHRLMGIISLVVLIFILGGIVYLILRI